MKYNSVVSVVRDFILIVVKVKQRSERSQIFYFNTSEVKQRSVVSEKKQCRERSQIFHLNSSEGKQLCECSQ